MSTTEKNERVKRDDIRYALAQLLSFYDKELDDKQWKFWATVLMKLPYDNCMRALREYIAEGKFAPKPADIVNISKRFSSSEPSHHQIAEQEPYREPDHEAVLAWKWFIGMCCKDSANMDGIFPSYEIEDPALRARYLHLVNHEARRLNNPNAIPDEYKLQEVWSGY